jgi:hypothetical protein
MRPLIPVSGTATSGGLVFGFVITSAQFGADYAASSELGCTMETCFQAHLSPLIR